MVSLPTSPGNIRANTRAAAYRPRRPLESDLHRLVREHFDTFRAVYPERYARKFGHLRPIIPKAVHAFLQCGDLAHGFARVRCPNCRHEFFVAFSCKQRAICPSCAQKRTLLFGLHVAQEVCLDVPHRQFVWTIPKRLRIFFRFHRNLLHRLPPLAWQTILGVYRALLGAEALPGGIIAIQTFGSLIHFHPHLHALITDGAFAPDGQFLSLPSNLTHQPFLRLWENKVFRLLLEEGLIQPSLIQEMRCWRHSGFHVDRSVLLPAGDRQALERLAQYMARAPFSLARLIRITQGSGGGKVLYKAEKDSCQRYPDPVSADLLPGAARNYQVFEPLDFLAELTQHIPNKGEHLIRSYGRYSNKIRGQHARPTGCPPPLPFRGQGEGRGEGGTAESPASSAASTSSPDRRRLRGWAILIKRIYQTDPLRCPRCGATMKILSFIEARQGEVIRKILEHCGLWHEPPRPPPPPPPPPEQPAPPSRPVRELDPGFTLEADPDFLEHSRREEMGGDSGGQLELPWDD